MTMTMTMTGVMTNRKKRAKPLTWLTLTMYCLGIQTVDNLESIVTSVAIVQYTITNISNYSNHSAVDNNNCKNIIFPPAFPINLVGGCKIK